VFGRLYVDGGPSQNAFLMQIVADYLDHAITPCRNTEASALGAAHLAGLATGFWPDIDAIARLAAHAAARQPAMPAETRATRLAAWRKAVARTTL
jgi:glycerol kinase